MSLTDPQPHRVVIVGAGPAGLALAIELGHRKIPCLVVERNARVGYAPRAKTTHVRTREHMRRWGISEEMCAASPLGIEYPSNVLFVTRLNGYPLAKFENSFNCSPKKNPLYAEHAQWIPQYSLEEVMRKHAQSLPGVEIRFNCEYLDFEQNDNNVRISFRDINSGSKFSIDADYLVGADGARSRIRDGIGAVMHGERGLSRNYNIIFRAPGLAEAHPHGPGVMYWQVNSDMPSLIGPMDDDDKWYFMPTQLGEGVTFTNDEAIEAIKVSTGIDLPYEILSSDEWVASSLIADKYRQGRVFLTGDACHLHPPFGGFGMFLGILDSIDLGWKMAAVLNQRGGKGLLESYEIERKSVHNYVVAEAVANHQTLSSHLSQQGLEDEGEAGDRVRATVSEVIKIKKQPEFNSLGVVLGYRYEQSPIIIGDGSAFPPQNPCVYTPSACPGCRAPHAWLDDGSSLFDHFGDEFTLLIGCQVESQLIELAKSQAVEAGVVLKVLKLDDPAIDALYQANFTLIRPDQHVAWRDNTWPDQAVQVLRQIAGYDR
jgi:2-polyprenyl-6-methoxyphenol hydroxylase-like FAD-dependent oxidoreductase